MATSGRSPAAPFTSETFVRLLEAAWRRRAALATASDTTAYRVFDGLGDGLAGLSLDRYGPAAVLNVYEDARLPQAAVTAAAALSLECLARHGVEAVYVKAFSRDRSRLGGHAPDEARSPIPRAGAALPESVTVREHGWRFEVRPYDGLSTGLFLEHREHRRALAARAPRRVLNLFAYTCAFAVPLAAAGAEVTNVDVSARYLAWGRRNLALNGLDAAPVRFLRRDALDVLERTARRPDERYDLVILDPPTFAAGDRRRGVPTWRALEHYPALVRAAVRVVAPSGVVFAATNTRYFAVCGALPALVGEALGRSPAWQPLPPWPADVTDQDRVSAVLFTP